MWRYFTAVRMGDRKLGRCNDGKCQAHTDSDHFCLLSGRSTQSLWRHLRSHHPEIAEEEDAMLADKQAEIAKQKKDAAFQLKQFVIKPPSQLLMTEYKQTNAPKYQNNHPHQKVFDRNFKNLIVHDALPFNLAGSVWFNKLVHDLDPRLNIKHRTSYSRQVRKEGKIVKRRAREHTMEVQNSSCKVQPTITYSVATSNRFSVLHNEQSVQDHHDKDLPVDDRLSCPSTEEYRLSCPSTEDVDRLSCSSTQNVDRLSSPQHAVTRTPYPLPQCIPSTPAHLSALVQNMRDWGSKSVTTVPLPHMLHDIHAGWIKSRPRTSPNMSLSIKLHLPS